MAGATTPVNGRDFGDGQVKLSWSAPAETGGIGIAYYVVGTERVYGTSLVKGGLPGGVASPSYDVVACNFKDICGPKVTLGSATPLTKPAAPTVTVVGGLNKATVTWVAGQTGGADATYEYAYTVDRVPHSWQSAPAGTFTIDVVLPSHVNSASIEVFVRASNSQGTSREGVGPGTVIRPREPDQPPNFTGTPGDPGSLRLSWSPATGNGTPVTEYQYRVRTGREPYGDWVSVGTALTTTVTGLPGGEVDAELRAFNGAGNQWSQSATVENVVVAAPPAPGGG